MKFIEKNTLQQRGPVDPALPCEVNTFLIGETPVATWNEGYTSFGHDYTEMFPAWYQGARFFLIRKTWSPAYGYSASGVTESLVPFDSGINTAISQGCWDFLVPSHKE